MPESNYPTPSESSVPNLPSENVPQESPVPVQPTGEHDMLPGVSVPEQRQVARRPPPSAGAVAAVALYGKQGTDEVLKKSKSEDFPFDVAA